MQRALLLLSSFALAACSSQAADDVTPATPTALVEPPADAGAPADASRPITDAQRRQADELASMVSHIQANTGWHAPLDWSALTQRGRDAIFAGDGSERAYVSALFDAFIAVPQGHQGFHVDASCGKSLPYAGYVKRGVCGRPHARGIVVTSARANNPLGLSRGDLVVGVNGGTGVLDTLASRPMCTASRPSRAYRDASTAATFADLLAPSERIEIEAPNGTRRTVVVPAEASVGSLMSCQDPFGRDTQVPVESSLRADGVGVIRLPGFLDPEQQTPTSGLQAEYDAYIAAFQAKIAVAFDALKSAPAIVWDIRGNGGGATPIGLAIASGFPGANAAQLSYCQARIPASSPPAFDPQRYVPYALTPGGRFAYAGKVAVLTDGLDYSAADYFPLVTRLRTKAILVGAGTAGAYGSTSDTKQFAGPPVFSVATDLNRCSLADGDVPLEGKSVEPHVPVDYDPVDLAAGRDTVLERAVTELRR